MSPAEQAEQYVQEYFEVRNWTVDKLDTDNEGAADFRISDSDRETSFLCEVKTIESAHANYPGNPLEWFSQQRAEGRAQVEQWKKEEPNSKIILRPGEYEFLYGDPVEFAKKYRRRQRYTEYWFSRFADELRDELRKSDVGDLPYRIRLDSQDLYRPSPDEQETFIQWLRDGLSAIHQGSPSGSFVTKMAIVYFE